MKTQIEIQSTAGMFLASFSEAGLAGLTFPSRRRSGRSRSQQSVPSAWIELTRKAVDAVLRGNAPAALPPLDLSHATDFQRSVWKALQEIPCGSTQSYAGIATRLRKPNAARAVGNACGANPIPLLIPCHRVLANGQRLGGFSGGLEWKQRLLTVEGIAFR